MNYFDLIILAIVVVYGIRGVFRGFIGELLDIFIVIASVVVSVLCVEAFAVRISKISHSPLTLATVISFFVVYWVIANVSRLLIRFVYRPGRISIFWRIWGAALGLLRGLIAAGIFAFIITQYYPPHKPQWEKEKSLLIGPVSWVAPAVYTVLITAFPRSRAVFSRMGEGFIYCADLIRERAQPPLMEE